MTFSQGRREPVFILPPNQAVVQSPDMKRTTPILVLVFLSLVFAVLACNLSGSSGPPTLVPRPSATPPPTIGYATLSPAELPQQATVAPPRSDVALTNLLNQVDADRMFVTINTLQGFGTRF